MYSELFHVAVLLGNRSNPFWTDMKKWYDEIAQCMKIGIQHFQASPENDREAQLELLDKITGMPFDAVIINPMSRDNLVKGILNAAEKGMFIIDVGAKTNPDLVKEAGSSYIPIRTVDFFQQGYIGGSYICKKLESSGGGKVVIIEGRPDSAQSISRSAGAAHAFKEAENISLVASENADFDSTKAGTVALKLLHKEPDINAIFCTNDVMSIGAAHAVKDAGVNPYPIIVGVDLTTDGREAILNGLINASIAFSPKSVADVIMNVADKIRKKEKINSESNYAVTSTLVNIENIDTYTG